MPEWDTVRLDFDDDVATLTVNRPDRLNALNVETLHALREAISEAESEDARVLVLTGAGEKAFIAGADISHMQDLSVAEAQEYAELGHEIADMLELFPAPVIAAMNGYTFGGGCELALACDFRVASEDAVIGQTEIDLGIIPGWGGTQRLTRLVGDELARRLIYFGERIDAQDAHEIGLVGEVVAHDQIDSHASEMAADLAERPAFALQAAKEALNQAHEGTQSAGLRYERRLWSSLFGTHDQREGMSAFLDDREPDFE
ncbi:short chain enoyl-CoA hydratase [Haladaptatus litoreus]|uniref:Short chain enoyl-CoA hydratase n=1 Tax=Haladaptatus litoreus TaxID=553468 RepID=A0A1N6VNC5_9EURY|nr:enoyl-CoA hydratase-related protein [Haladaptatus litoreus]SIQ79238.1 short chain enoyl-CoA hydratase [Haladaptatus litoreus]